jgi:sugar O-acyltransferase (sialic acid O-acetyltransferase NeuD family)
MKVLMIGAGGHARVLVDALKCRNRMGDKYEIVGFLDDDVTLHDREQLGIRILGSIADIKNIPHDGVVMGIGENATRQKLYLELKERGENILTVLHPRAILSENIVIGEGTVVIAGVVINNGARIGSNVIINTSATVGHDSVIGAHSHICPGVNLGGGVKVGEGAFVGMGSVVIPNKTIGDWVVVGAGAAVIHDVHSSEKIVGVPAVHLEKHSIKKL